MKTSYILSSCLVVAVAVLLVVMNYNVASAIELPGQKISLSLYVYIWNYDNHIGNVKVTASYQGATLAKTI